MRSTALALFLSSFVVACAAGGATPATAAPGKAPKAAAKAGTRPRVPTVIGAATAERVQRIWDAAAGGYGRGVAVSSRLSRVAFANKDGVELFELSTGKSLGKVQRCRDVVRGGVAFHGGDLIIVCEKSVVVVDGLKHTKKPDLPINGSRITAAAVSGARLALGHHDGVVRVYGLDGSATTEIPVPGPPIDVKSLALTRDGSRIAVAWVQGSVWWWDLAKPSVPHDLVRHESESDGIAFSDDGNLLAEEGGENTTTLWELGEVPVAKAKLKNGAWVKRILFTRDGKWLARGGSDGLELAEVAGPKRVALDPKSPVEDAAFDESGAILAASARDGRLTLWAVR